MKKGNSEQNGEDTNIQYQRKPLSQTQGIRNFLRDDMELNGVEYSDEKADKILSTYNYDYDKILSDAAENGGVKDHEAFKTKVYDTYGITKPTEDNIGEIAFLNTPAGTGDKTGYERYKQLEDELELAKTMAQTMQQPEEQEIQLGQPEVAAQSSTMVAKPMEVMFPEEQLMSPEALQQKRATEYKEARLADVREKINEIDNAIAEQAKLNIKELGYASQQHEEVQYKFEIYNSLIDNAIRERNENAQKMAVPGLGQRDIYRKEDQEKVRSLRDIKDLYQKMGKILGSPQGSNFDDQMSGLLYGFGNNFFTKDFATMGLNEMSRLMNVKEAFDTMKQLQDEGKTEEEINQIMPKEQKALIDTYKMFLEIQVGSRANFSTAIGEGLKEMIPFIAQFAATSGVGSSAKKIVKEFIEAKTKSAITARIAGVTAKGIVQGNLMLPATFQNYAQRIAPKLDENGNLIEGTSELAAAWQTVFSQAAEVLGEDAGEFLNKIANKTVKRKFAQMIANDPSKSQLFLGKLALALTRETGVPSVQNFVFEGLGEEVTGIMQAGIDQDGSFFTPEAQAQLWVLSLLASGGFAISSTPRRMAVKYKYNKAEKLLNDIPDENYTNAVRNAVDNYSDPEELIKVFDEISKKANVSEQDYYKARSFIGNSIRYNQMNTSRAIQIEQRIAQDIGNDGNVTLTYIDGQPYSVRNPEDLGKESAVIYIKDKEGKVRPTISSKITEWETKSPDQITSETIANEDQDDVLYAEEQQRQQEAADRGLIEGKTVNTPQGKRTLVSVNEDGTSTVANDKGEQSTVNTDEIEAYKTQEQKDAEKAAQQEAEQEVTVVSDEPLVDGSKTRVINYSDGTSKIVSEEGEQTFDNPEERDAAIKELAQAELESQQDELDNLPPEQAFAVMRKTDPETAIEIFTDDIASIRSQAEEARQQAKESKSRKEKQNLLLQAKQLESEADRLTELLNNPELIEEQAEEPVDERTQEQKVFDQAQLLSEEYAQEESNAPYNQLEPWQQELLGTKVSQSSFDRFGDPNNKTRGLASAWFVSKQNQGNNNEIDVIAQSLSEQYGVEVTPQDIVDFITANPTNSVRKTTNRMNEIQQEYRELTGKSIRNHKKLREEMGLEQPKEAPVAVEGEPLGKVPDDVPFRTGIEVSDKASTDLKTRQNAVKELNKLQDEYGLPIKVINSDELTPEAKAKARRIGRLPKAFYQNGTVYILSDQVTSVSDVKKSYLHEAVLHSGLDFMFAKGPITLMGKTYNSKQELLDDIFSKLESASIEERANIYFPGIPVDQLTDSQKQELAEEVLATLNETESPRIQVLFDKLYNYIKKLFGFTSKQFSKADLRNMLRDYRQQIINSKQDAETIRSNERQVSSRGNVGETGAKTGSKDLQRQAKARTKAGDEEEVRLRIDAISKPLSKSRLTLNVLNMPSFQEMEGKNVNPNHIRQLLNQKGIKAIEKDIINNAIDKFQFEGKRLDYNQLKFAIEKDIMGLQRLYTNTYASYGMDNLGDGNYGDANTVIFNTPVQHGMTGHFSSDFTSVNERPTTYEPKQLPDSDTWVAVDIDIPTNIPQDEIQNYIGTAGSQQDVETWIKLHEARKESPAGLNKGMFGHARVWDDGDTRYIVEAQSDVYQQTNAKKRLGDKILEDPERWNDNMKKIWDDAIKESIKAFEKIYHPNNMVVRKQEGSDMVYEIATKSYKEEEIILGEYPSEEIANKARERALIENEKTLNDKINFLEPSIGKINSENDINTILGNLIPDIAQKAKNSTYKEIDKLYTPQEKQFIASQKVYEQRLIKEAIKDAAIDGMEEVRIPTPHTIAVIEGFIEGEGGLPYEIERAEDNTHLEPGDLISYGGYDMLVTESWNDSFECVEADKTRSFDWDQFVEEEKNYRWDDDIIYQLGEQVEDVYNITREEAEELDEDSFYSSGLIEAIKESFAEDEELETVDAYDYRDDIMGNYDITYGQSIEDYLKDMGYGAVIVRDQGYGYEVITVDESAHTESFAQPDQIEGVDKADFDIEELSDDQQTVVNKYKELNEYLKNTRDTEIVEDHNGYEWVESKITDKDRKESIVAFRVAESQQELLTNIKKGYNFVKKQGVYEVNEKQTPVKQQLSIDFGQENHIADASANYLQWQENNAKVERNSITFAERLSSENPNATLIGQPLKGTPKVLSSNDIANIFSNLESASSENAFAVLKKDNGDYKVLYISTGNTNATIVEYKHIVAASKEYGANSVTLVHNHPSGNLKVSDPDVSMHKNLTASLSNIGVNVDDSIIINLDSGMFTTFNSETSKVNIKETIEGMEKIPLMSFDRQQLYVPSLNKTKVTSPNDVAVFLSKIKRGTTPHIGIIILDQGNNITRYSFVDESVSKQDLKSQIAYELSKYGQAVILSSNYDLSSDLIDDIKKSIAPIGTLLDAVINKMSNDRVEGYNSMMYEPKEDVKFRTSEKTFYSPTEKALNSISQEKGTVGQFESMLLKNGAKQAELDWMGFKEAFPSINQKVTKQDIQEWIDQNRIEVEEVKKGDITRTDLTVENINIDYSGQGQWQVKFNELDDTIDFPLSKADDKQEAEQYAIQLASYDSSNKEAQKPKYSDYQLPGGENYKELLLTIPPKKAPIQIFVDKLKEKYNVNSPVQLEKVVSEEENKEWNRLTKEGDYSKLKENYKSSHFNEPNILAHIRFNERTDSDGNRVLFLEEVQSDWAQEGRKRGFKPKVGYIEYRDNLHKKYGTQSINQLKDIATPKEVEELDRLWMQGDESTVPQMPFKQTDQWVNLAMRRMIRYAAENGFDKISWTTGEQQAERYDLSKQISMASASKNQSGTYNLILEDKNGMEIDPYSRSGKSVTEQELEDTIGKDIAKKLIEGANANYGKPWPKNVSVNPEFYTLRGVDLKVGGEGMKSFYNNIIPKAANKLGKKFGSKVETIELPEKTRRITKDKTFNNFKDAIDYEMKLEMDQYKTKIVNTDNMDGTHTISWQEMVPEQQLSLPITESMKESAIHEGMPLFRVVENERDKVDTNPSDAQKSAGNYKMGHVKIDGFDISIENPKGSIRSGEDNQGNKWSNIMPADYGYILGVKGADKDHLDVWLGEDHDSDKVFVVDQIKPDGSFDESKIMISFTNVADAANAYLLGYEEYWDGMGSIIETDKQSLKYWIKNGKKSERYEAGKAWFKAYPGISNLVANEGQMPKPKKQEIQVLRSERDKGIGGVEQELQEIYRGRGEATSSKDDIRQKEQRQGLRERELPLGNMGSAIQKQTKRKEVQVQGERDVLKGMGRRIKNITTDIEAESSRLQMEYRESPYYTYWLSTQELEDPNVQGRINANGPSSKEIWDKYIRIQRQNQQRLERGRSSRREEIKFRVTSEDPEIQKLLDKLQAVNKLSQEAARIKGLEREALNTLPDERQAIYDKIEAIKEGAKLGKKDIAEQIKEVQNVIIAYAKKAIPLTESGARDLGSLLTTIRDAQTPEAIDKAFQKIEDITGTTVDKTERRKAVSKVNRLLKWMTGLKKSGTKRVGKFNYEDTQAFQDLKSVDKKLNELTKKMNSYKSTAEEKMDAQAELDRMFNELEAKEDKNDMDNAIMKLIELRRLGSKASPKLAQIVAEELEAIYTKAKDAKNEVDMENALQRNEDREEIKEYLREKTSRKKLPVHKRAVNKLNEAVSDIMGNWETLLTMIGGTKLRDKYSLMLDEAQVAVGKQESVYWLMDKAMKLFGTKTRVGTLNKIHELSKEEYSLRPPNQKGKEGEGDPMQLSKLHLMDIYNAIKNEDIAKDYFIAYGDITLAEDGSRDIDAQMASGEKRIMDLINNLSTEEKAFADAMQQKLEEYYDKMNEIHIKFYNRDLPKVKGSYWPSTAERQKDIDVLEAFTADVRYPSSSHERANRRTPLPTDAFNKFMKHIEEAEWFVNMAVPIQNANKLFGDVGVKRLIEDKFGENFYKNINIALVNSGLGKVRESSRLTDILSPLLNNWVASKIGATPSVPLKQLLSSVNYAENMPMEQWASGFVKGLASPKDTWKEMMQIPYLKTRLGDGYSEAVQRALNGDEDMHRSKASNFHQAFKNLMTIGTRYGDMAAIVYGGKPYLDYLIKVEGLSEKEAVDKFLQDTLRSQQAPFNSTLSKLQNSKNVFLRAMFTFANTPSQYMRKLFEANQNLRVQKQQYEAGKITKEEYNKAKKQTAKAHAIYGLINTVTFTMTGALVNSFMRGSDPDDEVWKDMLAQLAATYTGGLPVIKDILNTATRQTLDMRTFDDVNPYVQGLDQLITEGIKLSKGESNDEAKSYQKIAEGVADMLGVPYANLKKDIQAIPPLREETFNETRIKESDDKLNRVIKKGTGAELRAAEELKKAYTKAKTKATALKKSDDVLDIMASRQMIDAINKSKVNLWDTEYSTSDLRMALEKLQLRLELIE